LGQPLPVCVSRSFQALNKTDHHVWDISQENETPRMYIELTGPWDTVIAGTGNNAN